MVPKRWRRRRFGSGVLIDDVRNNWIITVYNQHESYDFWLGEDHYCNNSTPKCSLNAARHSVSVWKSIVFTVSPFSINWTHLSPSVQCPFLVLIIHILFPLNVGRLSFNTRCNPFANSSASAVSSKYRADTMVLLLFQDIRRYQIYPFLHKAQIERILRSNPTLVCRVVEGVPHFVLQRGD